MLSCLTLRALDKSLGRDALPPSTGILDRADLQLRSLQDIDYGALVVTHRSEHGSATKGSSRADPLPLMRLYATAR